MIRLLLLTVFTIPALTSYGQQLLQPVSPNTGGLMGDEPRAVHVTDILNAMPEAVAAINEFHRLKAKGLVPYLSKTFESVAVGDTVDFRQYNENTASWSTHPFILSATSAVANVWVAVSESDGPDGNHHVTAGDVQILIDGLSTSTPAGSFNPSAGIVMNDRAVFGEPPNVDGDGKVDVLLYDIQDHYTGPEYVAGFVISTDLSPTGPGNGRDVLHLDSFEGIYQRGGVDSGALSTGAHELQHLIHLNYSITEETFVNEGLSEYAEILNGFDGRGMNYLASSEEQNRSMFYWDSRIIDYERAGLLTTYMAQRTDPLTVGSITRDTDNGKSGINNALSASGLSLEGILPDFHTATLLNGTGLSLNPDLGFSHPSYANVRAIVAPSAILDGRTMTSTTRRDTVRGGGVIFRVWEKVEDFSLDIGVFREPGQTIDLTLGRVGLRAIAEYEDGSVEIRDLTASVDPARDTHDFPGKVDRLTLLLCHLKPVSSSAIPFNSASDRAIYLYTATWSGGVESTLETTQYDSGVATGYFSIPTGQGFATRFEILEPQRTSLDNAELAIYYLNQFSGGPADTSPRDFTLHVWDDDGGLPGAEIFSRVIIDGRPNVDVTSADLRFLEVDLSQESLPVLPPVIHVGASNAGTDDNTVVVGFAPYSENVSSHFAAGSWTSFWDVPLQGGGTLDGEMAPIRLTVLVGPEIIAIEERDEVPQQYALEQNFPNPFNPSTTIQYALPRAGNVRLTVFDVLGRQVATMVNGTMAAGRHTATVDATNWASGLYVYMLEAGDAKLTRNMVLLR